MAERTQVEDFYRKWRFAEKSVVEGYVYDEDKKLLRTRYIFSKFLVLLRKFLTNQLDETEKINILTGLRGTGKTTLLAQLYLLEKYPRESEKFLKEVGKDFFDLEKIYLDVSRLRLENIRLNEFFNFFEEHHKIHYETIPRRLLIILDEVQYDTDWGLFLKSVFDRTKGHKNILVIATGSSALRLKMNPDLVRRSSFAELFPLKFSEYLILKHDLSPKLNFADDFIKLLANSENADDVFAFLKSKEKEVSQFWVSLPIGAEDDFLNFGGFPFGLKITNEQKIIEKVRSLINNIIIKDIPFVTELKSTTFSKLEELIFLLASSHQISFENLASALKMNYRTVVSGIDVLVKSGLITKVNAFGRAYTGVRKAPKTLFLSPSLRYSILGGIQKPENRGSLLEDYCSLLFTKDFQPYLESVTYDYAEGGADFILTLKDRCHIVVEVGFNKEEIKQVENTLKKVKGKYGIVFGSKKLELINKSIVKIPLRYLLLI